MPIGVLGRDMYGSCWGRTDIMAEVDLKDGLLNRD